MLKVWLRWNPKRTLGATRKSCPRGAGYLSDHSSRYLVSRRARRHRAASIAYGIAACNPLRSPRCGEMSHVFSQLLRAQAFLASRSRFERDRRGNKTLISQAVERPLTSHVFGQDEPWKLLLTGRGKGDGVEQLVHALRVLSAAVRTPIGAVRSSGVRNCALPRSHD